MPDDMDRVQELSEQILEDALNEHRRRTYTTGASLENCCICEKEIPEARRQAMPGCCKCIACQTEYEQMHGR